MPQHGCTAPSGKLRKIQPMDKFLTYTAEQRERAIRETAARMQLHPTPVEKDFWVCYLLRELFNLSCVKDHLIFKGGRTAHALQSLDHRLDKLNLSHTFFFSLATKLFSKLGTNQGFGQHVSIHPEIEKTVFLSFVKM